MLTLKLYQKHGKLDGLFFEVISALGAQPRQGHKENYRFVTTERKRKRREKKNFKKMLTELKSALKE